MRPLLTALLLLTLVLHQGCFRQIAVGSLTGIMEDGFLVLNEEPDLELAEAAVASNLKLLESVLRGDPGNERLLLLACRGYASYAMGFIEDRDPERAREFYRRGRDFGLRLFPADGAVGRALRTGPAETASALRHLGRDDVPGVFWTAIGWGGYISLGLTDPDALAALPRVEAMMEWVRATDPAYFHGGADFFLGTLLGSRPPILGGNPESSRAHFERALELSGGRFLLTHVYYARSYAVQAQDSALFARLLATVAEAPVDLLPAERLSNAIAKKKAALLREKTDELF